MEENEELEWSNAEKSMHEEVVVDIKIGVKEDKKTHEFSITYINMPCESGAMVLVSTKEYVESKVAVPNSFIKGVKSEPRNVSAKELNTIFSDIQTALLVNKKCHLQFVGKKSEGRDSDGVVQKVNYRLNYSDVKGIVIIEPVADKKGKK